MFSTGHTFTNIIMPNPIPFSIIRDLKCGHCRRFMSCGPVHVTPDSSLLCGRCLRFSKRIYRNFAFEAIASIYIYPCHYWSQHCNKKLFWNEALDHERNCLFKSGCNVFCVKPGSFFKSDRKFPSGNGDLSLEQVNEDILEQLQCVCCNNYLSNSPIYLIIEGQSICHRCVHSNGIPNGSIRNLGYEQIAENIIFPCIYRLRGCTIRMKFGRDLWEHEHQCSYGIPPKRLSKKPSKNGKERGVIETHSGHIWGTITPHSALFAPPKTRNNDGMMVTQELVSVVQKKKNKEDEARSFDSQSMDSMISRASTFESIDNISRTSSRPYDFFDDVASRSSALSHPKMRKSYQEEVIPSSTPPGYNKVPYNGYYPENMMKYSSSFNYPTQIKAKKSESFRMGNQEIINELKERNHKKQSFRKEENPYGQCHNLQDIVQIHDEVFST